MIDSNNHTDGQGLSKAQHIIIDAENQDWRSNTGIDADDDELADELKSTFSVDCIRVCKSLENNNNDNEEDNINDESIVPPSSTAALQVLNNNRCIDLDDGYNLNAINIHQWVCEANNANQKLTFVDRSNGG